MISIDITLIIQTVNFLVSLWIINHLIIKPVRSNLQKRRSIVNEDVDVAESLRQNAEIAVKERESVLSKVRAEILLQKHTAKEDAEAKATTLLHETTESARVIRSEASVKVREEKELAVKELEAQLPHFTKVALAKVLD